MMKITDKQRMDFLESAGRHIDLFRTGIGSPSEYARVYPHENGAGFHRYTARTVRAAIDKAIEGIKKGQSKCHKH